MHTREISALHTTVKERALRTARSPGAEVPRDRQPRPATVRMLDAFTVDLEDWAHGLLGGDTPITPRVVRNVERVLALLERHKVRATFFALGKVCRKFPQLLPRVAAAGHEIASHGFGHQRVFNMTPEAFRDDVQRSIDIIGEQVGVAPIGYRAPAFSITQRSLWAGAVLADLGFKYSSSIFPIRGARYGIFGAPRYPFRWSEWQHGRSASSFVAIGERGFARAEARGSLNPPSPHDLRLRKIARAEARGSLARECTEVQSEDLLEFPMTTLALAGRRWPVCGGGYLRLLPTCFLNTAIQQAHRHGQPGVVYVHPYELDVNEVSELQHAGWRFGRLTALKQSLFRCLVKSRLADLLRTFKFAPMREVLGV